MKKLERFIGGTTNRPMKTRRSGMLIIQCTRSNRNLVRERHLHCTALPDCRSSRAPHRYFLAQRKATTNHFGGPPPRAGMTTTIWRPRVRIDVPDVGDAENTDTSREELSKEGTKRKRAPPTKGPCEHGVKPRSQCKVCSACPHGRLRTRCKECGGGSICEHGRQRTQCKECGGSQICEHGRQRSMCKECGGSQICEHGRIRSVCKECGGASICEHGRERYRCKDCRGNK